MATYYVDPAAAGLNDGSSWTDAWTDLQTALDTATAGDTVYCRGTQTLSVTLDVDTNSGTNAGGWIKFIGCNASGVVDGTKFTVDANGGAYHAITHAGTADMYWWENFRFTNTGVGAYHGYYFSASGVEGMVFVNCDFDNNGGYGCYMYYYAKPAYLIGCRAYSNTDSGFYGSNAASVLFLFCSSYDNSDSGFDYCGSTYIHCAAFNNTNDGFATILLGEHIFGCVVDGNTDDGVVGTATTTNSCYDVFASRITNHSNVGSNGINCTSEPFFLGWNLFHNNDSDTANATLAQLLQWKGTTDSNKYDPDVDDGYVDASLDDYNLKTSRTYNGDGTDTVGLGVGS